MKKIVLLVVCLILTYVITTGCGETIDGLGKDINRIGKGVKTVFVRDN
jgi:predicted small secreted protein